MSEALKQLLLTRPQVAEILNLCERSIFCLDKAGTLPAVRIGSAVRYRRSDVEAFAESGDRISMQSK